MLEFVQVVLAISCVAAAPILIIADNAGWEALFGEDEQLEESKNNTIKAN